jgi:hypothetical protein
MHFTGTSASTPVQLYHVSEMPFAILYFTGSKVRFFLTPHPTLAAQVKCFLHDLRLSPLFAHTFAIGQEFNRAMRQYSIANFNLSLSDHALTPFEYRGGAVSMRARACWFFGFNCKFG